MRITANLLGGVLRVEGAIRVPVVLVVISDVDAIGEAERYRGGNCCTRVLRSGLGGSVQLGVDRASQARPAGSRFSVQKVEIFFGPGLYLASSD